MSIAEAVDLVEVEAPIREPEGLYEIVDGRIKEKPLGNIEIDLGSEIGAILRLYSKQHAIGRTFIEGMFRTRIEPKRIRRPDVAFVSAERLPLDRPIPDGAFFAIAPDLAIEVISPSDPSNEVQEKIGEYFRANVRQVWIIHPRVATITVYESPSLARVYYRGDVLDGGDILPGFRLAISDLLPEPPAVEAPAGNPA